MACRLCLNIYGKGTTKAVTEEAWKGVIPHVFPQLALNITSNPTLCEECNTKLWHFKVFKDTCYKSEANIYACKSDQTRLEPSGRVNIRKVLPIPKEKEEEILRCGILICRVCLQLTVDCHVMGGLSTYTMLIKNLFQELDLEMTYNPMICRACAKSSEELYQFQEMCLHVENTLQDNCIKGSCLSDEDFVAIARKVHNQLETISHSLTCVKSEPLSDLEEVPTTEKLDVKTIPAIKREPEEYQEQVKCEVVEIRSEVHLAISNIKAEKDIKVGVEDISSCDAVLDPNETENNLENYITLVQEGVVIMYKCFFCEYSTKMKRYAKAHIISKHNKGASSYDCLHCNFKTEWDHLFRLHMSDEHQIGEVFQCSQCPYQARRLDVLRRHIKVKHTSDGKSYKCEYCGHETKLKSSLRMHIKVKHEEDVELFACPHCEYKTKRPGDLKMHVRCRHDAASRTYPCAYCPYTTRRPSDLNIHVRAKHDENRPLHRCPHCEYETRWRDLLRTHLQSRHGGDDDAMSCHNCGYKTRVRAHLRAHMRVMHGQAEQLKCPHCDYTTKVKSYLNKHVNWNHLGLRTKAYEVLREQQRRRRQTQAKTKKKSAAATTTVAQAPPTAEKNQLCPHCDYRTARKSDLRSHVAVRHDRSVTYPCPYCDHRARWKHSLHVHRRVKHGDVSERYTCTAEPGCEFSTTSKAEHTRHMQERHGQRAEMFGCPHCRYQARTETYVARHVAQMHAGLLQLQPE